MNLDGGEAKRIMGRLDYFREPMWKKYEEKENKIKNSSNETHNIYLTYLKIIVITHVYSNHFFEINNYYIECQK